jgi:hypothetical protein
MSPVPVQMWQSRGRMAADRPVPVTMWQGGGPIAGADVARQDAAPMQMWFQHTKWCSSGLRSAQRYSGYSRVRWGTGAPG